MWVTGRKCQVEVFNFIKNTSGTKPTQIYWPIAHCHNHLFIKSLESSYNISLCKHISDDPVHWFKANLLQSRQSRKHTILLRLVLSGQYIYWEIFGICEKNL